MAMLAHHASLLPLYQKYIPSMALWPPLLRRHWRHSQIIIGQLYAFSSPPHFNPSQLTALLDPLALGWLSDSEKNSLCYPIIP